MELFKVDSDIFVSKLMKEYEKFVNRIKLNDTIKNLILLILFYNI
tara:strand:+ start:182 stop:316 length:135 start_codon:yes stop_codon:yes gene_type:complete